VFNPAKRDREKGFDERGLTGNEDLEYQRTMRQTPTNTQGSKMMDEPQNFRGQDLRWRDFSGQDLRHADLRDANLHGANLTGADLRCANITEAHLRWASLTRANLTGADLTGVIGYQPPKEQK